MSAADAATRPLLEELKVEIHALLVQGHRLEKKIETMLRQCAPERTQLP